MSAEERAAYRQQIMKATTAEERERIRAEHHEKMMVRAKAQGVTLPDPMPAGGMGQGRQMMGPKDGSGMGGGMKGK